jgi:hypothetical protein
MRPADFIGIGAQKAGTSWLWVQLRDRPDVFMPEKELRLFVADRPDAEHAARFAGAAPHQRTGDISPIYLHLPEVPARIAALCPAARLVLLLRDPVTRAVSQWRMARAIGTMPATIGLDEAFAQDLREIRTRGEYARHIARYDAHFRLGDALRVFFHADIVRRPEALLRDVAVHVGIDPAAPWPHVREIVHAGAVPQAPPPLDAIRAHYRPHDAQLRDLLGTALPWD